MPVVSSCLYHLLQILAYVDGEGYEANAGFRDGTSNSRPSTAEREAHWRECAASGQVTLFGAANCAAIVHKCTQWIHHVVLYCSGMK